MTERVQTRTVIFAHPFALKGVEGTFPPGAYAVEVTEEQLDGLSSIAHRHLTTTITLPAANAAHVARQVVEVDPADLEAALASDAEACNGSS